MAFQQYNLMGSRNVSQNIALPLEIQGEDKKRIQGKVEELLSLMQLRERRYSYPHELSGGQKQRVALARALITEPHILLCDEITSALDPETTASILELLQAIQKRFQITVVLVTHELSVAKSICHRVALLQRGRLLETGAVEDFFLRPQEAETQDFLQSDSLQTCQQLPKPSPQAREGCNKLLLRLAMEEGPLARSLIASLSLEKKTPIQLWDARKETIGKKQFIRFILELPPQLQDPLTMAHLKAHSCPMEVLGYVP